MRSLLFFLFFIAVTFVQAQSQPKLIVGIVVDQMRMEYLHRYHNKFDNDGFIKLMDEGFTCKNAHFNYTPTYTGPGHASIYTGCPPKSHGIIANHWYDKSTGELMYCVSDKEAMTIGSDNDAGKMSPKNLVGTSLGDAVRISSQFRGKSIGVSIKDRGAILPAGHSANAAYWLDYESGKMVSSSYYLESLPSWVSDFNAKKWPDKLSKDGWNTLLSIEKYTESTEDNTPYEAISTLKDTPTFPYDVSALIKENGYYAFAKTPFGNTFLRKFAELAIINEDLGIDEHTDLLALSFSSPDIIGHAYGPQSIEVEDTYLRLDREIAALIAMLDDRVGNGEYVLFLTSDHGAAEVPNYLKDHGIPTGLINRDELLLSMETMLQDELGEGAWIDSYTNQQVFLNKSLLKEKDVDEDRVYDLLQEFCLKQDGISGVLNKNQLQYPLPEDQFAQLTRNGWNQKRSGDLVVQYAPGWLFYEDKGTSHGSSYNYDTHIPIIFYGKGIQQGETLSPIEITQLVPTVCLLSNIGLPDMADHRVIEKAIQP